MEYYIFIIYEDGSKFEWEISNKKDIELIPKNKAYEAIKIVYKENPKYSHVMYGNDFIYINYYKPKLKEGFLEISQWDNNVKQVVQLKGVEREEIKTDKRTLGRSNKTLIGKLLDDEIYEKMRLTAEKWRPF